MNDCAVSRQRDASIRLSQPKSTPTASRRSSQSSVGSMEDSSSLTDGMPAASLINSKLHRQFKLNCHSTSVHSCTSRTMDNSDTTARERQKPGAGGPGSRQVSVIKTAHNNRVQQGTDNVTDMAKSQTANSMKIQMLPLDQKTRMMAGSGSTSIMRPKHAASKEQQLTASPQLTSGNDEITIARHKPTVSNTNTNVSRQHDTTDSGSGKDLNTVRTSRLAAKPHLAAMQTTRNTNCMGCN